MKSLLFSFGHKYKRGKTGIAMLVAAVMCCGTLIATSVAHAEIQGIELKYVQYNPSNINAPNSMEQTTRFHGGGD